MNNQTSNGFALEMITDEATAALRLVDRIVNGNPVEGSDWEALFQTEGYRLLEQRERSMGNAFTPEEFQKFVYSLDETAGPLTATLQAWVQADLGSAARRALAYLPSNTPLRARIYLVIKPKPNSFVFQTPDGPGIFLYLNPNLPAAKFENTLTHELHHIGFSECERRMQQQTWWQNLMPKQKAAIEWLSAFGEGIAMLAAAGGPDIHPHASGTSEDRARWDQDMEHFEADFGNLVEFFKSILSGKLDGEEMVRQGMEFFGYQGPWYTVGWMMAVVVERGFGREALVGCLHDPRQLLGLYNRAAEGLPRWPEEVMEGLGI